MNNFDQIRKRLLADNEKSISSTTDNSPFVFESDDKSTASKLHEFLSENSREILEKMYKHGAVLLRGFRVSSETEFEHAITGIKGFSPMDDYFMAEPGRILIDGCKYVYYTNRRFKTGGTLNLGGFHTENHYTCDVPHFISFWCRKRSVFGGETGLVNMSKVYEDMSSDIKEKLKKNTFFTLSFSVSELARRYDISERDIKEVCTAFGLAVDKNEKGEDTIVIYKPSVINHPETRKPSLVVNISAEIPGLDRALVNEFRDSYLGARWKFHRIAWRSFPNLVLMSQITFRDLWITVPWLFREKIFKKNKKQPSPDNQVHSPINRIGSVFTQADIIDLSKSMRKHFSSFDWKKGDILLIDNLQMAHAGMPGFGSRLLRAVLANPLPLEFLKSSSGYQDLDNITNHISLAERIASISKNEMSVKVIV